MRVREARERAQPREQAVIAEPTPGWDPDAQGFQQITFRGNPVTFNRHMPTDRYYLVPQHLTATTQAPNWGTLERSTDSFWTSQKWMSWEETDPWKGLDVGPDGDPHHPLSGMMNLYVEWEGKELVTGSKCPPRPEPPKNPWEGLDKLMAERLINRVDEVEQRIARWYTGGWDGTGTPPGR